VYNSLYFPRFLLDTSTSDPPHRNQDYALLGILRHKYFVLIHITHSLDTEDFVHYTLGY